MKQSFQFNFQPTTNNNNNSHSHNLNLEQNIKDLNIVPSDSLFDVDTCYDSEKVVIHDCLTLWKRKSSNLVSKYFGVEQDVIRGVYEGGFKLWEGAIDLVKFLDTININGFQRGLELGCGHGLPGIYALQKGIEMDFQDFNESVITQVLFPNIVLNKCTVQASKSLFLAGDWSSLIHPQLKNKYDCLLASEVVYRTEWFPILSDCLLYLLKEDGVAYIAGKCFYFGVGGGTTAFQSFLRTRQELSCACVDKIQDGKSNVREILQVKKLNKTHNE
ncbi:hypothetical protein GAYE_SCF64G6745 [Galdieria yellowstonensis]|uniref:protein-histidine N-methyltransferase n=1 Tax=Galdieria yellowstonensis TaxID=3028027 RepID=A0AAV9IN62_9RHOD|nr:hypothetical protein GAYE_SCF64G6745 [Galdieria yellowstonensis]